MCLSNADHLYHQNMNFLSLWLSSFGLTTLLIPFSLSVVLIFCKYFGFLLENIEWSQTHEVPVQNIYLMRLGYVLLGVLKYKQCIDFTVLLASCPMESLTRRRHVEQRSPSVTTDVLYSYSCFVSLWESRLTENPDCSTLIVVVATVIAALL